MATFTGVSQQGFQSLAGASSAPNGALRISFPGKPIPPAQRVGYFYVYTFSATTPFQSYLVDSGVLYIPGYAANLPVAYFAPGFGMRVDVIWNRGGENWRVDIN